MARGGITEYHVQRARDALLARGMHPSIDAVRIELGNTGSRTTIHRYLKALETAEGTRLDDEALLSETLRELVATLAARLHAEANDKIAAVEHRHAEALQRVEAERDQHQAALEAALEAATEQREALANECALHRDTQATLSERTTQTRENAKTIEALEQRLQEKDTMIASLEEKHRHAQESLAHYRDSVKAQRDQDQRQHEQQVQHLQAELREQHQTAAVKQNEITQLTRDNARLAADMLHQQQTARELKQARSGEGLGARHACRPASETRTATSDGARQRGTASKSLQRDTTNAGDATNTVPRITSAARGEKRITASRSARCNPQ